MAKMTRYSKTPAQRTVPLSDPRTYELARRAESRPLPRRSAPPPRRKNKKKRDWTPVIVRFLAFVAVAALIGWLLTDKRFDIAGIAVEGNRTLPSSEIRRLAGVHYGSNVFAYVLMNHKQIDKRIEVGEPGVAGVHVRPRLPNQLAIRIQERVPYAQLRILGGPLMLVDETGVPFRFVTVKDPLLPALIVPADVPVPPLGTKMVLDETSPIGAAFNLLRVLNASNYFVPLKLRDIKVNTDGYMLLNMSDRPLIRLGIPTDLDTKLQRASDALTSDPVRAEGADYIDVTVPDKPAIMMKGAASATKTLEANPD